MQVDPEGARPAGESGGAGEDAARLVSNHPELAEELGMIRDWLACPPGGRAAQPAGNEELTVEAGTPPRVFGGFRILRKIGSGGMATVFEAEDLRLQRRVALKILSPRLRAVREALSKFEREAQAGGRQDHEGIVTIYSVGEVGDVAFIAQELVGEGRNLEHLLDETRRAGRLPEGYIREIASLIAGVAHALAHAHAKGVIHRDVKPSNILLAPDGRPKVSDFGLARVQGAPTLSATGDMAGTPYYMSPEQAAPGRGGIDHRTDVFSLGVTLYEALTLARPFDGANSYQILKKVIGVDPPDVDKINSRVPRDLAAICAKAMDKDPRRRYQTMGDFASDLERFLQGEATEARPRPWVRRAARRIARHRLPVLAGGGIAAVAAALLVLALALDRHRRLELEMAEACFVPAAEALGLTSYFLASSAWLLTVDSSDPFGAMLTGVASLENQELEEAVVYFGRARAAAAVLGDRLAEQESRYLRGLARLRQALCPGLEAGEEDRLVNQALSDLAGTEHFDPAAEAVFVRRYPLSRMEPAERDAAVRALVRLNRDHYGAHLANGVNLFQRLYLGGEKSEFDASIEHLEKALQRRPDSVIAAVLLARARFFLARFYRLLELLPRAEELLARVPALSGASLHPLVPTTLGQIRLLRGDTAGAMRSFEEALAVKRSRDPNVQNIYRGIAEAHAREGRLEESAEWYQRALDWMPGDPHVNVGLAELHLAQGRLDEALVCARTALAVPLAAPAGERRDSLFAGAFLLVARIRIQQGLFSEALEALLAAGRQAVLAPNDVRTAVALLAVLRGEPALGAKECDQLDRVSVLLAQRAAYLPSGSPACLSCRGVAAYLRGRCEAAAAELTAAIAARNVWPEDARAYLWPEDASDRYFLAMIYHLLASGKAQGGAAAAQAAAHFAEAERLYKKGAAPFGTADLIDRIRSGALKVLAAGP